MVTTPRNLFRSYSGAEQRINDLAEDINLTRLVLIDIAETVEECKREVRVSAQNFSRAKAACQRNFQRLDKAIRQASEQEEIIIKRKSGK